MADRAVDNIAAAIGGALREQGLRLALAESCTGGLASSMITDVPGSSEYFLGSVTAYHNDIKKKVLGVRASTLDKSGAVSRQTAREMAEGAAKRLKAEVTAAITGIAGPGGGSKKKPVGLVYIAVSKKGRTAVKKFLFKGSRKSIKRQSAEAAMAMLAAALKLKPISAKN